MHSRQKLAKRSKIRNLSLPVTIAPALANFAGVICIDRSSEIPPPITRSTSLDGATSPCANHSTCPQSMYSIKRTMWPVPAKLSRHLDDFAFIDAALDHHVDLHRASPASVAASMPASTSRTEIATIVHAPKRRVVGASSETVIRFKPSSAVLRLASQHPSFVVKRYQSCCHRALLSATARDHLCKALRSSGSPPVNNFFHACCTNSLSEPRDFSNFKRSELPQKAIARIKDSFGCISAHRKLQRS